MDYKSWFELMYNSEIRHSFDHFHYLDMEQTYQVFKQRLLAEMKEQNENN